MLATLLISLSIHVVMLQVLRIPFPDFAGASVWLRLLNLTLALFALTVLITAAQPRLGRFSKAAQCLIVFLLYAMLKESFRSVLMNGVVTTAWRFDIVTGLPSLAYSLVVSSLLVFLTPLLRTLWVRIAAAAALAGIATFALRPALGMLFAPAMKAVEQLDHPEVYGFPYGWHVLIPSYLTFAEPVIACMLIAMLTWERLSAKPGLRMLQFCLLIVSLRGMLLPTFLYSFYSKAKLLPAMVSESQFLFETLALAALTALVWHLFGRTQRTAKDERTK